MSRYCLACCVVCMPNPLPPIHTNTRSSYLRRLVLHNPADVRHIQPPRRHVRAEEDSAPLGLGEALQHPVPLLLHHLPVQRREAAASGGGVVVVVAAVVGVRAPEDGAEGRVALEESGEVVHGGAGDEEDHHLLSLVPLVVMVVLGFGFGVGGGLVVRGVGEVD